MSIVTSRRSLILGLTSLVAAPSLVRATSLMPLKGTLLDPWVLAISGSTCGSAFNSLRPKSERQVPSLFYLMKEKQFRLEKWHALTPFQQRDFLNENATGNWIVKRASDLKYI